METRTTLERLLQEGKISRREFLAQATALGLTAAMSPALLPKTAAASTPQKGGRLRIGGSGCSNADTLDPALVDAYMPHILQHGQLRNCLAEIDHTGNAIPELAESWEASPDAKIWTFKLRRGVEFHNGKTMDADDVLFSYNYHRSEGSKSPAKTILKPLKELRKDGSHAIVFELEQGNADFPFTTTDFQLQVFPAGTTDFSDGMGTGPYVLVEFQSGVRALTRRNPNYWKEGRAHFDEVETICITDASARVTALINGSVDFIDGLDAKIIDMLAKKPGINVDEKTGTRHFTFPMLTDAAPFDNNDVRMALKHAVDREHLLKIILRGHGSVANDHPISTAYRYFDPEIPQRTYDPEKAKHYLKKAGLADHTFKLHVAPNAVFSGAVDAALLYKEHAAKAGIKIDVVRVPDDGYWKEIWLKKPWCATYWLGRPTEDQVFTQTYAAGGPWNDTHWENERFNVLLKAARSELDDAKRREMYSEMQRLVRDEGGQLAYLFRNWTFASRDTLRHGPLAGNLDCDGMKVAERWWFA